MYILFSKQVLPQHCPFDFVLSKRQAYYRNKIPYPIRVRNAVNTYLFPIPAEEFKFLEILIMSKSKTPCLYFLLLFLCLLSRLYFTFLSGSRFVIFFTIFK